MACLVLHSSSSLPLSNLSPLSSDSLIGSIALMFQNIISQGERIEEEEAKKKEKMKVLTIFDALKIPTITLHDFLKRIISFTFCSAEIVVLALIYIDRLVMKNDEIILKERNIHRFLENEEIIYFYLEKFVFYD